MNIPTICKFKNDGIIHRKVRSGIAKHDFLQLNSRSSSYFAKNTILQNRLFLLMNYSIILELYVSWKFLSHFYAHVVDYSLICQPQIDSGVLYYNLIIHVTEGLSDSGLKEKRAYVFMHFC